MSFELSLREYLERFYDKKDEMHNLNHIHRVQFQARMLCEKYFCELEDIKYAIYLHGLEQDQIQQTRQFMEAFGFEAERINAIVSLSKFTQSEHYPSTIEEQIIHDAHVIEGGKYFLSVKSLITGVLRGQSLVETLGKLQDLVDNRVCYLGHAQEILEEQINIARDLIDDISKNIPAL